MKAHDFARDLEPGQKLSDMLARYRPVQFAGQSAAGINVNASLNTKATTYSTIVASAAFDADGFFVRVLGSTTVADGLIDIAFGAASSEVVVVSNLCFNTGNGFQTMAEVYIPLPVPAGTRVSMRMQSTDGSNGGCNGSITLVRGGIYEKMRLNRATTYGANTADSGGVSVDPGGSANTFGNWIQIDAAIANPIKHAIMCIGGQNNGARTDAEHQFELGTGANPNEVTVIPNLYVRQISTYDALFPSWFGAQVEPIPAGTRLVARQAASITDATDRLADVVVIGFD